MTKKKELNKKILGALMGFYESMSSVYLGSFTFEDEVESALLVKAHLHELIGFHKKFAEKYGIPLPELDKYYKAYLEEWNTVIMSREKDFENLIKNYEKSKKKEEIDYIS